MKKIIFQFLFIAINFHLLRNLSTIFLIVTVIGYAFAFLLFYDDIVTKKQDCISLLPISMAFAYVIIVSIIQLLFSDYYDDTTVFFDAIVRFLFVFPIVLFAKSIDWSEEDVSKIINIYSLFVALGCLSIPFQFWYGPIPWFAEASTRSGFDRFAPLFGNLTSTGIVGGLGIIAILFSSLRKSIKLISFSSVILGMALSLQKAAVANFFIALILFFILSLKSRRKFFQMIFLGLAFGVIFVYIGSQLYGDLFYATFQNFRFSGDGDGFDDVTVFESIQERLFLLPSVAFERYGLLSIVFGVGLIGGAGVFGYTEAPMAHNNFIDFLLLGGIPFFCIMIGLFLKVGINIFKQSIEESSTLSRHRNFARAAFLFLLINLPFASGTLFQPNTAVIFWFLTGLVGSGYFSRPIKNFT